MSDVFVTTYQIMDDAGNSLANAHWAEFERVQETHFAFMREHGALAYRPSHSGQVGGLFFDAEHKPPADYRGTGDKKYRAGKWLEEKVPRRNSKAGRALQKLFFATERLPNAMDLVSKFGWQAPRVYPNSGNKVHFPTLCRVSLPRDITFLRLPRKANDGWNPPTGILAIPEDELMLHFHAHNTLAKETDE